MCIRDSHSDLKPAAYAYSATGTIETCFLSLPFLSKRTTPVSYTHLIACTALIANKMAIATQDEGSKVIPKCIGFGSWKNDRILVATR